PRPPPDPDDAFMFWGLTTDLVDTRGFEFEQVLQDIQTLNAWALEGRLEVTAVSPRPPPRPPAPGGALGWGSARVVAAREPMRIDELREREIVVPGSLTTAFL